VLVSGDVLVSGGVVTIGHVHRRVDWVGSWPCRRFVHSLVQVVTLYRVIALVQFVPIVRG